MEIIFILLVAFFLLALLTGLIKISISFDEFSPPAENSKTENSETENSEKDKEEKKKYMDIEDHLKLFFYIQLFNLQHQQKKQKQKEEKLKNSFKKSFKEKFCSFAKNVDYEEISDIKLLENSVEEK